MLIGIFEIDLQKALIRGTLCMHNRLKLRPRVYLIFQKRKPSRIPVEARAVHHGAVDAAAFDPFGYGRHACLNDDLIVYRWDDPGFWCSKSFRYLNFKSFLRDSAPQIVNKCFIYACTATIVIDN